MDILNIASQGRSVDKGMSQDNHCVCSMYDAYIMAR